MWRISRTQTENTFTSFTVLNEFGMFYDNDNINSYQDIKTEFIGFTLDPEIEREILDENCASISTMRFYLTNNDESLYLFVVELQVGNVNTADYNISFLSFPENIFNENSFDKEGYYIKIIMETKYYKNIELNNNNNEESDEEILDFNMIPAIMENKFAADECCICLINKPNILNFPCLHLSVCEECELTGRFLNCACCRKRIERKVKI